MIRKAALELGRERGKREGKALGFGADLFRSTFNSMRMACGGRIGRCGSAGAQETTGTVMRRMSVASAFGVGSIGADSSTGGIARVLPVSFQGMNLLSVPSATAYFFQHCKQGGQFPCVSFRRILYFFSIEDAKRIPALIFCRGGNFTALRRQR